jgi:hypothetical protein
MFLSSILVNSPSFIEQFLNLFEVFISNEYTENSSQFFSNLLALFCQSISFLYKNSIELFQQVFQSRYSSLIMLSCSLIYLFQLIRRSHLSIYNECLQQYFISLIRTLEHCLINDQDRESFSPSSDKINITFSLQSNLESSSKFSLHFPRKFVLSQADCNILQKLFHKINPNSLSDLLIDKWNNSLVAAT